MKVAIVHDWLVGGGAEKVVLELHRMYPDAPIYTSYCSPEWRQKLDGKVVTGWLQHFGKLRKWVPFLRIWWFSHLNLTAFDVVISSSGAEAKGIKVPKSTRHINYCHAPTHYYWARYDEYMAHSGFGFFDPVARLGLRILVGPLRKWDYKAAQRPDLMIANSTHTQSMIKKYYGRDSEVIHPPVEIERFESSDDRHRHGFVAAGRQTPYKRIDLAVQACSQLNLPLVVIGDGPDNARLRNLAGPTVTFLGRASDVVVEQQFSQSSALIFAGWDDFGITPVEAMAAGTPVIAYKLGGALDYVIPGKTGEFFEKQTVESLMQALRYFDASKYKSKNIRAKALEFSPEVFRTKMANFIASQTS